MSSPTDLAQAPPLNAAEEPEVSFPYVKVRWMEPFAQDPRLWAGINRDKKPRKTPNPKPYEYKTNQVRQYAWVEADIVDSTTPFDDVLVSIRVWARDADFDEDEPEWKVVWILKKDELGPQKEDDDPTKTYVRVKLDKVFQPDRHTGRVLILEVAVTFRSTDGGTQKPYAVGYGRDWTREIKLKKS